MVIVKKKKVFARWRNWNIFGAAAREYTLADPQSVTHRTTPAILLIDIYLEELQTGVQTKICA
jgi:hypothetical protein